MFPKLISAFSALTFTGLGIAFIIDPVYWGSFVDFHLISDTSKIEISTFYGGFELAIGIFLFGTLRDKKLLECGLSFQSLGYAFCALTRLSGILRHPGESEMIWYLLAMESLLAILSYRALSLSRKGEG